MSTDVSDHKIECSGCGADITDRLAGEPCPACGDTRRRHLVSLHDSATATDSLSMGVEYVQGRPWQEMWTRVQQRFAELVHRLTVVGGSIDEAREAALEFCLWCYHLMDWLQQDPQVTAVSPADAKDYVDNSSALKLCADVANTVKHHTRYARYRPAWIGGATGGDSQPVTLRVDYREPSGTAGSRDALDLARAAIQEWEQFIIQHGLS